ncbi:MAG: orotate phosphoribosyltransferase [Cyanobacteria bacterium P01_H01_bin.15]
MSITTLFEDKNFETVRSELLALLAAYSYQEGDFTLSSGHQSDYYIDCKKVTLMAEGAVAAGALLLGRLPVQAAAVAGLTLGADPLITAVSLLSNFEGTPLPGLIVRKKPKGHGTENFVEGPSLPAGSQVVVLEDVVTTGQSALKAVEHLKTAGFSVNKVIALVDRNQGGAELYSKNRLSFEAIYNIREIQAAAADLA